MRSVALLVSSPSLLCSWPRYPAVCSVPRAGLALPLGFGLCPSWVRAAAPAGLRHQQRPVWVCWELLEGKRPHAAALPGPSARARAAAAAAVVFFPFWSHPVASFPEPETSEPRSKAAGSHPLLCC